MTGGDTLLFTYPSPRRNKTPWTERDVSLLEEVSPAFGVRPIVLHVYEQRRFVSNKP